MWEENLIGELSTSDWPVGMAVRMFFSELIELGRPTLKVGGPISWSWPGTEWKRKLTEHKHVHILRFISDCEMV